MSISNKLEVAENKEWDDRWTRRFDFFGLATWLVLGLYLAGISLVFYGEDFRGYYAAARVLLGGGNPYDYHQVAQVLLEITGKMGNNPYYYPPWFTWFFISLTTLPFQMARAVWMMFNLIIWDLGLWNLRNILDVPFNGWRLYMLYALATFSFAWITWRYEQAGILIFVILVAVLKTIKNQQWSWAGFWMALSLIKPNITLIVVLGLTVWLIRQRYWRPVLIMGLWLIGLTAISTLITPDWYQPLFEERFGQGLNVVLDGPDKVVALRLITTMLDWLRTLGIEGRLKLVIYGVVAVAGIMIFLITIWNSASLLQVMSISLLVSYTLTPYAMQYDNPSLFIVVFWALSLCLVSRRAMRIGILLAGFVFSVIFWQQNISWAYWMVVGSVALAAWAMFQSNRSPDQFMS